MPIGTARNQGSSGEGITHFGAVRFRIVGSGTLINKMYTLSDARVVSLPNITLQSAPEFPTTILSNFKTVRASLECYTDEIDEYFKVNRIIIFTRPLWTGIAQ